MSNRYYLIASMQRSEEWMAERADKLKEDVRALFKTCSSVMERVNLVDAVQHLGIDHLFEEEMDITLHDIHKREFASSSLHEVALRFRLLREHGLWVSPDAFNIFKGVDGKFNNKIVDEPRGLLSLYNAVDLLVHGEPELEEAMSFARHHLESLSQDVSDRLMPPLVDQVKRALRLPLPRTIKRTEAVCYMMEYEYEEGHITIVLELAKLDFNLLQRVHLKELKTISKWWKDLYEHVDLNYVRDRVVEAYTWSYSLFHEKDLALTRMINAEMIVLITILDDTYDSYATIPDCQKLNAALQRWEQSAISLLPDYMKKFYDKLLNIFKDFEDQVADSEKYRVAYTIREFQNLSTCYLREAEWGYQNHKPRFEDQIASSAMSSSVPLLCVVATIGRGDAITKEAFEWVASSTGAIMASAKIGRFMNDIAAFKRGKNMGDVASSVECYINEYSVTDEVALAKIDSLVEDEWRTMNQARFDHRAMQPAVQQVLKFTVSMVQYYEGRKDAYTFATHLQDTIESLFVKSIPI